MALHYIVTREWFHLYFLSAAASGYWLWLKSTFTALALSMKNILLSSWKFIFFSLKRGCWFGRPRWSFKIKQRLKLLTHCMQSKFCSNVNTFDVTGKLRAEAQQDKDCYSSTLRLRLYTDSPLDFFTWERKLLCNRTHRTSGFLHIHTNTAQSALIRRAFWHLVYTPIVCGACVRHWIVCSFVLCIHIHSVNITERWSLWVYVQYLCEVLANASWVLGHRKDRHVKAGDEWGGSGGNSRRSDLTWRRSWLPLGHGLSLSTGISVLFPGPLAQVRQRRWVSDGNRKRNIVMFFHTYHTDTWY